MGVTAAVISRKLTEQELAAEELLDDSPQKPKAAIIGADGNIFNLLGIAQKALKDHGQREQADEMTQRVFKTKSYEQAWSSPPWRWKNQGSWWQGLEK